MKRLFQISGFYLLGTGIAILCSWILILHAGELSEGPVELGFHLVSEVLLAFSCIFAGLCLRKRMQEGIPLALAAHAMLIYSVLNALGYYAQLGQTSFSMLFVLLFMASMIMIILLVRVQHRKVSN